MASDLNTDPNICYENDLGVESLKPICIGLAYAIQKLSRNGALHGEAIKELENERASIEELIRERKARGKLGRKKAKAEKLLASKDDIERFTNVVVQPKGGNPPSVLSRFTKKFNAERKAKNERIHKISKIRSTAKRPVQGGGPGSGKGA